MCPATQATQPPKGGLGLPKVPHFHYGNVIFFYFGHEGIYLFFKNLANRGQKHIFEAKILKSAHHATTENHPEHHQPRG